jgi:hypothetical protein
MQPPFRGPNALTRASSFASWKWDSSEYNLLDVILTNERNEYMTSARKAEANRQNALKSTGPKTPEGKAAVRHNSLRHGLLSEDIVLPGEDEEALRELAERLSAELQPVGELETILVGRVTSLLWRLRRLERVEAGMFVRGSHGVVGDLDTSTLGLAFIRDGNGANAFSKLSRYETTMERGLYKALHELQRLQTNRGAAGSIPPPLAVDVDISGIPEGDR